MNVKNTLEEIFHSAGIRVNGNARWDIKINDERFYRRVFDSGNLGLGESYMDGWWETPGLDEFFFRLASSDAEEKVQKKWKVFLEALKGAVINTGSKVWAFEVGKRHYDIGNALFRKMLDRRMVYTCGYWKEADDLDSAQEAKLELACRKLRLKPGDRVLDIGCGWGGFARYAAEKYNAKVVGLTVSEEQVRLGEDLCKGLPVEFRLKDYREINEEFDHIVSLGMFEHVGYRNYAGYMQVARKCLKDGGLFLLHTIGGDRTVLTTDKWMGKYIFPNSHIPSLRQISEAAEGLFIMEDLHNFGYDYDRTLMSWFKNFHAGWEELKGAYDERFYRMWKYYLLSCAGMFRARKMQVWQIVFSKEGIAGGYMPVR